MTKWVYSFGNGSAEGDAQLRVLLGGKGANLAEISNLGMPVHFALPARLASLAWHFASCY
jgi:pyruvate, orthophosphate dikinase